MAGCGEFARAQRFELMQDEEVVHLAHDGDPVATEFLMSRYRSLVESKARSYYVVGADRDDVIQEGMIGLYKAIRDFRSERLNKFRPFAELCVTRQIITAIKTATRHKHGPLNAYVSLNRGSDRAELPLLDSLPDSIRAHPASTSVPHALPRDVHQMAENALSDLERSVLRFYLDGLSYQEMSQHLCCHTKSIDNALQRVKRKMGSLLKD